MTKKQIKKEYEKKDCLDCHLNNCGICDIHGAINKPVRIIDCENGIIRVKGN